MAKSKRNTSINDEIYHDQVIKMWLYFKTLDNEEVREEFISFIGSIYTLSQKKK